MPFEPIRTERLLIRQLGEEDAEETWRRRNQPEVAELQNWTLPYPLEKAQAMAAENGAMDGPADGEWWMAVVADQQTGETYGDLALHLTWGGRTAEVGYTFAVEHWGNGYATEAARATLERRPPRVRPAC